MSAHLRTPKQREEHRKSLHKSTTPNWRAKYAERCRERLRESRSKLLSKFRKTDQLLDTAISDADVVSTVQDAMSTEWEAVKGEYTELFEITHGRKERSKPKLASWDWWDDDNEMEYSSDEVTHTVSVIDELTQELIAEEKAILAQYEESVRFDESSLCATIESSLSNNDIICPVCQKNILLQNGQIIFCACGLRLDTAQDCISLDFVRQQLEDCSTQHSAVCIGKPVFSLETTLGTQNIIMNCTTCDFMYIVV